MSRVALSATRDCPATVKLTPPFRFKFSLFSRLDEPGCRTTQRRTLEAPQSPSPPRPNATPVPYGRRTRVCSASALNWCMSRENSITSAICPLLLFLTSEIVASFFLLSPRVYKDYTQYICLSRLCSFLPDHRSSPVLTSSVPPVSSHAHTAVSGICPAFSLPAYKIDEGVYLAFAGISADGRVLASKMRLECQSYRYSMGAAPSVGYIARYVGESTSAYLLLGLARFIGLRRVWSYR